ncbi:alginate export family protein [Rhizorhabdus argentea]|uniref:alginate export family protein n=1 Tax=Rhizorhabdus argentea TaxID=1387174 RepID=UPI0030EF7809
MRFLTCCLLSSAVLFPAAAQAVKLKPIIDTRLRYENVDQTGFGNKADALTARARLGVEAVQGPFSFLVEAEATLALDENYSSGVNRKTALPAAIGYPVVADPENVELNRIQVQYKGLPGTVLTAGRQRINLDDQRFVGSVGWRQNEQTFDAVRAEWSGIKNLKVDVTYSWSDRTIWGIDGGRHAYSLGRPQAIGGDNIFANVSYKTPYGSLTGFYYRVDEDKPVAALLRNSSSSFGGRFSGSRPLTKSVKWTYTLSYAHQQDIGTNPINYSADYFLAEGSLDIAAFKLGAGVEQLGADRSVTTKATGLPFPGGFAFQTPFATLHKFQGWADKFLTTPAQGITDYYASAGYGWKKVGLFDVISATAVYHRFDSDVASIHYGDEIDVQLQAKVKKYTFTAKYADYQRQGIASFAGDADTKKIWLQVEWAL